MRYFNAEFYSENGYQNAISLHDNVAVPKLGETMRIEKFVGKQAISFYDFKMLDTSAFTIFDFATKFTNYLVDEYATYL